MSAKIDQKAAKSASLKEESKALSAELTALAKQQAEMDSVRKEQHEDYSTAKAELETGLTGVSKALAVLRDYYGSAAAMVHEDAEIIISAVASRWEDSIWHMRIAALSAVG